MGCSSSRDERRVMDVHIRADDDETKGSGKGAKANAKVTTYYDLGREIGQGGFGKVYEATHIKTGKMYAVKMLSKLQFQKAQDREHMKVETELMARVKGQSNVVSLHETYEDKWNFYLVMEYCTGGELMQRIVENKQFSEKTASTYFRQMCEGIKWCHAHNVVHRDLKPENFLFATPDPDAPIKITDFGLATYIEEQDSIIKEACGSAYYIAPEVFTRHYTKSVDVWSLGIVLYLLLSGTVPFGFDASEEQEVYHAIQTEPLVMDRGFAHVSAAAHELIAGLLEKDPHKRYTLDQALNHPWVKGSGVSDVPIDRTIVKSMVAFNRKNKFKKAALKLIASTLSASEVQKLRAAFHEIDTDRTGSISYSEMMKACQRMGVNDSDVEELMKRMDEDGDGVINYDEFLTATADRQLVNHQNNIWWAFCEYDRDGDGKISVEELMKIIGDDRTQIAAYVDEFDRDKDGMIDYEEFMRMVLPKDLKIRIAKYS